MRVLLLFSVLSVLLQIEYYNDLIYVILLTVSYSDSISAILLTVYLSDLIYVIVLMADFINLTSQSYHLCQCRLVLTRLESQPQFKGQP